MNCQNCNQEIVQISIDYEDRKPFLINTWECPNSHVTLHYTQDKITSYTLYFERNAKMYRLSGSEVNGLRLAAKVVATSERKRYVEQLHLPHTYIEPTIKDNIIQIEHLVEKLRKLVIFS